MYVFTVLLFSLSLCLVETINILLCALLYCLSGIADMFEAGVAFGVASGAALLLIKSSKMLFVFVLTYDDYKGSLWLKHL